MRISQLLTRAGGSPLITLGADAGREHVAEFGVACMRPDPGGEVAVSAMRPRYEQWCFDQSYPPLPAADLARELGTLFANAGLVVDDRGEGNVMVRGLKLV